MTEATLVNKPDPRLPAGPNNRPAWDPATARPGQGFYEVWYLKLNSPDGKTALWLRFTLLISRNGFKRVAESWAILFERNANGECEKTALKETTEIREFAETSNGFRIGSSEFGESGTRGRIRSKGRTLEWDLGFTVKKGSAFNFVPEGLSRAGLVKNLAVTVHEDLRFTGWCELDGKRFTWKDAPGMQGHLAGEKYAHSWAWAQCNSFVDSNGQPADLVFDGLTARVRLRGPVKSPALSAFYFRYHGKDYAFNSVLDTLRLRSGYSLSEWRFQADRDDLSFRGIVKSNLRDFAGLTYEDTDGRFLYCSNSKLNDMTVLVYRHSKLESTFVSTGTTAFEVVSREKSPYVPILI